MVMTFENIQELIAKDEHRCLELKKTTGELQDGMHSACAFLNTNGGWLIFGVAPTSLKILGQQVTDNTQREIAQALAGLYPAVEVKPEYIDVPGRLGDQLIVMHFDGWKWGQMPYTYRGCPYYKNESTTQVMPQEMYEERLRAAKPEKFAWERQEADGVSLADLDEKRIRGAVRLGVERGRMPATAEVESVESLLNKWNLMRDGKVLNGAVALFGKNLSGFTQMSLRLARFRGTNKNEFVDSGRADGNFFDLLDAGMSFLFKHLSLSGKIVGFQKEEYLEIPAEALREALTNALCHRQLEKYNLTPSIAVYDDRVEIENPGRLPFDLTPETIKSAHASYPYNPQIAEVLFKSSFLESWGSGVGRMIDACRVQGVPEPEYEVTGGFVKIVFRRTTVKTTNGDDSVNDSRNDSVTGGVNGYVNGYVNGEVNSLTPSQKNVYDIVHDNPGINTKKIADILKKSPRTIEKHIALLAKASLIEHRDSDKTGGYYPVAKK